GGAGSMPARCTRTFHFRAGVQSLHQQVSIAPHHAAWRILALPAVMLGLFALTLFVSASLLFLIEPMVGKLMLPLLGGTPAVWNTCMLFFQAILLAGYLYAHLTTKYLGPRKQAVVHLIVIFLPILYFLITGPLTVYSGLIEGLEGSPILALLLVLS